MRAGHTGSLGCRPASWWAWCGRVGGVSLCHGPADRVGVVSAPPSPRSAHRPGAGQRASPAAAEAVRTRSLAGTQPAAPCAPNGRLQGNCLLRVTREGPPTPTPAPGALGCRGRDLWASVGQRRPAGPSPARPHRSPCPLNGTVKAWVANQERQTWGRRGGTAGPVVSRLSFQGDTQTALVPPRAGA